MPVGHLPQPDEHKSELYSKQFKALVYAESCTFVCDCNFWRL